MNEPSWFLPLPDFPSFSRLFSWFSLIFSLSFLILGKFFTVKGGTLPPWPPRGYATVDVVTNLSHTNILSGKVCPTFPLTPSPPPIKDVLILHASYHKPGKVPSCWYCIVCTWPWLVVLHPRKLENVTIHKQNLIILQISPTQPTLLFQKGKGQFVKGALDKYNIYLFISNSIEDFKLNQHQNFQFILPMRFPFLRVFVNSIISKVSHRLLYFVFIEVDFEN